MRPFEYAAPTDSKQAIELLGSSWDDAAVFAGGTDLLGLMKDDVVAPKRLVNVKQIGELKAISFAARTGLRIGAGVHLADVADNVNVRQQFPALAAAVDEAASPQIRNMATLGGNLCQRPRCWYFRNGFGLLGMKDGKSLVREGDNRYHAILGNDGPALFVSPSSIAPALVAYNARVRLVGPQGPREVELAKFFVTPTEDGQREHDLKPNEVIVEVVVPAPAAGTRSAHYEVRQKYAFDWPLATAAVALEMAGGTVKNARVVLGQVAPVPWVSEEAAAAIQGKAINEQSADAAGMAAVSKARGLGRNDYKIQLARVAVKRALLAAAKGTEQAVIPAVTPDRPGGEA